MYFNRPLRDACYHWGHKPVILLAVAVLGLIGYRWYERAEFAETEKAIAIADCAQAGSTAQCRQSVESHHEVCFEQNYSMGDWLADGRFNRPGYRRCLELGPDDWLTEKRQIAREQDSLLNLPFE